MIVNDSSRVRFYNLTAGSAFPIWTTPEQRKKLRKNKAYQSRVMVLQDFNMPEASQKMKITRDLNHLFVSGSIAVCPFFPFASREPHGRRQEPTSP